MHLQQQLGCVQLPVSPGAGWHKQTPDAPFTTCLCNCRNPNQASQQMLNNVRKRPKTMGQHIVPYYCLPAAANCRYTDLARASISLRYSACTR